MTISSMFSQPLHFKSCYNVHFFYIFTTMAFYCSQTSSQPPNIHILSLVSVLIFFLPLSAESLSFQITSFDANSTNIVYEGDAVPFNGDIRLNRVDYVSRVGRATHIEHVRVWDPSTRHLTDFTTNFSFVIDTQGKSEGNYGHGIVFFLAPVDSEIPPNSYGGCLGLLNTTSLLSPSKNNILGVEFDSFSNPEWDPPGEHVGFIVNSLSSSQYMSWNATLHSLDVANAQVSYEASTQKLNLLLTYKNSPSSYNVSLDVDLRSILPEWVKIGFSTATGINTEIHRVLSWDFSSNLEGKEQIEANNTTNKETNTELIRKNDGGSKLLIGLAITLGVLGAVLAILLFWAFSVWKIWKKKPEGKGTHPPTQKFLPRSAPNLVHGNP
ncbi:L-type lectin-domain-containing protein [Cinnamomum micranthum f. kanehirae]|uniref:L-type lectin-domain-containing protein n=1 Tax=Cinnamomum micranthum f. kanehirae TaxID=337451 RepID=A0A3S3M6F5_9MAGN|nr:L-type lectin-domain-containing protein [Cinnamomum micranthum f. kanehirae]